MRMGETNMQNYKFWLVVGSQLLYGPEVLESTVLSYDVTAEEVRDWARMMDIEFVGIGKDTTVEGLDHDLFRSDLAWKLK